MLPRDAAYLRSFAAVFRHPGKVFSFAGSYRAARQSSVYCSVGFVLQIHSAVWGFTGKFFLVDFGAGRYSKCYEYAGNGGMNAREKKTNPYCDPDNKIEKDTAYPQNITEHQ